MRIHKTTWEDDGSAGFYCYNEDTGIAGEMQTISSDKDMRCHDCGERMRLIWDVSIKLLDA